MRIQHNIMAMNAYRNYNTNTSALAKNLEKLSSGYKINRAGDDAAGLAISEKMRAQITGLEAAQKNVKDGISLVKTAEGGMQEIQDMLNRMDYLATQSANGTYQDEVDRENLQKEVNQLLDEIDRIADSANFNGIKLLDGSLAADGTPKTIAGIDRIISTDASSTDGAEAVGTKTFLDGAAATTATKTKFTMNFSDLKAKETAGGGGATGGGNQTAATPAEGEVAITWGSTPTWTANDTVKIETNGGDENLDLTFTYQNDGSWSLTTGTAPTGYTASFDGDKLTLTADDAGAKGADVDYGNATITAANKVATDASQTLTGTGAVKFTNGQDAANNNAGGGNITVDATLNGVKIAAGVTVNDGDNATAIATAVFTALGTPDGDGKQAITIDGVDYLVTDKKDGTLEFEMKEDPTDASKVGGNFTWDVTITGGQFEGSHTAGTNPITPGSVASAGVRANTVFEITAADLTDGTVIELDGKKVTLSVGPNSTVTDSSAVKLNANEDINSALSKIAQAFGGSTDNFEVSVNRGAGDSKTGLAIYKKATSQESYTTKEELAGVFSIKTTTPNTSAKALQLQIGDTSDSYNQLQVKVGDMHREALGLKGLNIGTAADASAAIEKIKNAINQVSSVRGDLGATQNRLEHTANNLSVMAENIQDAESTIRDTDVAEEMMAYTKNNILVQSAQAMLAQANAVPQGVLQLLQ